MGGREAEAHIWVIGDDRPWIIPPNNRTSENWRGLRAECGLGMPKRYGVYNEAQYGDSQEAQLLKDCSGVSCALKDKFSQKGMFRYYLLIPVPKILSPQNTSGASQQNSVAACS